MRGDGIAMHGVLRLSCPDRMGIVAGVGAFLLEHACNILESAQFGDGKSGRFFMRVSDSSVLAVTAGRPCDVGLVGYEMAVLVEKCASALTPGLISELQTALPRSAIR